MASMASKLFFFASEADDNEKLPKRISVFLGFLSLMLTLHYFLNSTFYSSIGNVGMGFVIFFFVFTMMLLMPFPSLLKIEGKISLGLHSAAKSFVSVGLYVFFTWVGKSLDFHEDENLRKASLFFLPYLLTNEHRYHLEDEIAICDGYMYTGFGLMLQQKKIDHVYVFIVGFCFLCVKNYLQMWWASSESSGHAKNSTQSDDPILPVTSPGTKVLSFELLQSINASSMAIILLGTMLHFVVNSNFYSKLASSGIGFTITFFGIGLATVVLPIPPLMSFDGLNIVIHSVLKTSLSLGCFYGFTEIGKLMKLTGDLSLMKASLSLLGFLLTIEAKYHIEEEISLCDGYLYCGYGLMMAQHVIPHTLVFAIGFVSQWIKNFLVMSAKLEASSDGGELVSETPTAVESGSSDGGLTSVNKASENVVDVEKIGEGFG